MRKEWSQAEVDELERQIRDKVARGETLTAGEDTIWGVLRNGKPLTVRLAEEIDFMMGIFDD
jgi:hypothetical protein